jgi:putative hydrolase of the HAD superfamily
MTDQLTGIGYFDWVFDSYHLGKGKRDPALFTDVAVDLGLAPSATMRRV